MRKHVVLSTILAVLSLSVTSFGQPEIDSSFGKLLFTNGHAGTAEDTLIQPDGKIVMVTGCNHFEDLNYPFCAFRLNPGGDYDSSFVGSGNRIPGVVRTRPPETTAGETFGVALQSDGKLVLVGYLGLPGTEVLGMVRYHPNGDVDTSFGSGGFVETDITPGLKDRGRKIAIQPDGKIVVTGYSTDDTTYQQFVARYTTGGALDSTFAKGGIFRASVSGNQTSGQSIAIQEDGKILAGGNMSGTPHSYLLTRLNTDGSPDATWDGDGYKTITHSSTGMLPNMGFLSLGVQSDGRILALGHGNVIFRMNEDGSPDLSFSGSGSRSALPTSLWLPWPYDLTITTGGRITIVGHSRPGAIQFQYEVARYLRDGTPDAAFSGDGFLSIDINSNLHDGARSMAADSQGRIVIAGLSSMGACPQSFCNPWVIPNISVTRINTPTVSVGISGRVTGADGRPVQYAILTTQTGAGSVVTAITNPFGYYRFRNLEAGLAYTVVVKSKGRTFTERTVTASDDIANFDFVAQP